MSLYQKLFYADFTNNLCSDEQMVRLMITTELALVSAQEKNRIVPLHTAQTLEAIFQKKVIDLEKLRNTIPLTGNAAAPLVKQLVAAVKKENAAAAKYIHLGATSQDIVDTATVLKIKYFWEWLKENTTKLENILTRLTERHRYTVMIGRTLMQHARPITFGLKTATWLQGLRSAKGYVENTVTQLLCIQLGGAVGSQNEYITKPVRQCFAEALGLQDTPNWHTQRTHIAAFAGALGVLAGTLAKMATDIVLLSQTEVGEVFEPAAAGRGTSSTMPHKRNPVLSTSILANAHRMPFLAASILGAMPQAHERSAGLWHSEWETLDDIIGLMGGILEHSLEILGGLEVNENRMRQNIDLTQGLIFAETVALALAKKEGKQTAHDTIARACQQAVTREENLRVILEEMDLGFTSEDLDQFFQPDHATGASQEIINEILAKK